MIFRTQKLQELKNLQYQTKNEQFKSLKNKVLKDVWPQGSHQHFCQTLQTIGLTWMNQFVTLIENWLTQSSKKYITKLKDCIRTKDHDEILKIDQYLFNLSKYISAMQHPLLTSINNIHSLYLKFPTDELIQQPKKSLQNSVKAPESSPIKKKKSLSIQSFISNIPTKSRSTSKSRKLSFFTSSIRPQQSLLQTFSKQIKKTDSLNTTVKKVKKELPFSKTSTVSTFKEGNNEHNQKQNFVSRPSQQTEFLKQKLEQRLSSTCSSTFFNQVILQKSMIDRQSTSNFYGESRQTKDFNLNTNSEVNDNTEKLLRIQNQKKLIEEGLKRSILQQLEKKQKSNYDSLLKDIESKLSIKFDSLLDKIIKQKSSNQNQAKISIGQIQKQIAKKPIEESSKQSIELSHNSEQSIQQNICFSDLQKTNHHKSSISYQPSISNLLKDKIYTKNNQIYQINQIQEIKAVESKKQSKVNTSIIVHKENSKIIKAKNKTSLVVNNQLKQNQPVVVIETKSVDKNNNQSEVKNRHKNQASMNDSIDSIEIIDGSNKISKPLKSIQPPSVVIENKQVQQSSKKQDNFYIKRVKELKNKMEKSFVGFKFACQKLILPVNQTFMLIFSVCYKQFCQSNSLSEHCPDMVDILSKYKSQNEIRSKIPQNQEKFILDSLTKIEKMINLKCPPEKKLKIEEYSEKCIQCIENIFFEKPQLKMTLEVEILKKMKEIKKTLTNSHEK